MPPETRWRRRADARPAEILEAALAVFAERGFAASRMETIAERAGVSKGTIYLYFKSKEDVFKALLRTMLAPRLDEMAVMIKAHDGPIAPLLGQVLRFIGQFLATSDRVALPKMVIAEAGNFPDLARLYREEVIDRGLALLTAVHERAQARGEFRKMPPEHAARLTIAPMLVIAFWRTTFAQFDKAPYDYQGLIEAHVQTLLKGLAA